MAGHELHVCSLVFDAVLWCSQDVLLLRCSTCGCFRQPSSYRSHRGTGTRRHVLGRTDHTTQYSRVTFDVTQCTPDASWLGVRNSRTGGGGRKPTESRQRATPTAIESRQQHRQQQQRRRQHDGSGCGSTSPVSHGSAVVLLWFCCGSAVVLLWFCCDSAVVLLWFCCDSAVSAYITFAASGAQWAAQHRGIQNRVTNRPGVV
jgi:hypothetical protein